LNEENYKSAWFNWLEIVTYLKKIYYNAHRVFERLHKEGVLLWKE
jgi:hypothetical protein